MSSTSPSDWSAVPAITDVSQVRQLLLDRIPTEHRDTFFTPLHPLELTLEDAKIPEAGFQAGLKIIRDAIAQQKRVLIYGDYDCDGITATAVLWLALKQAGLTARPFLPRREVYGYGLSAQALADLWEKEAYDLVITVDNGIVAHEAITWLVERRIPVVVTDHHHPGETLPEASAIIHSSLLSGVGVAWMIARELGRENASNLLDLTTIGTLADQVPLYGANRSLVVTGLETLRRTQRTSLQTLANVAHIDLPTLTSTGVTFGFAPRLNAMGRLADPMEALRALISTNPERTLNLMQQLESTNTERQGLTQELFVTLQQEALIQVEQERPVLIFVGAYHEGIIGLLASKAVETYHRPTIVISTDRDPWKASARSVKGVSIIELLRTLPDVPFASLGGHALAAGFSLIAATAEQTLADLQSKLYEYYPKDQAILKHEIISSITAGLLNSELLSITQEFQPFGAGNAEPIFLVRNIDAIHQKSVGKQQQHWQLTLKDKTTDFGVNAIFFRAREKYEDDPKTIQSALVRIVPSSYRNRPFDIQVVDAFPFT